MDVEAAAAPRTPHSATAGRYRQLIVRLAAAALRSRGRASLAVRAARITRAAAPATTPGMRIARSARLLR